MHPKSSFCTRSITTDGITKSVVLPTKSNTKFVRRRPKCTSASSEAKNPVSSGSVKSVVVIELNRQNILS